MWRMPRAARCGTERAPTMRTRTDIYEMAVDARETRGNTTIGSVHAGCGSRADQRPLSFSGAVSSSLRYTRIRLE